MYIDKENTLCSAQAVTASAATTDYIDLGSARDIGMSKQLHVAVTVDTTPDSATDAATIVFSLEVDDNSSFSSAKTTIQSKSYAIGDLAANDQFFLPIPVGTDEQYLRGYFTIGTENLSAGAFTVQVVEGIQKNVAYPDAL